MRDLSLGGVNPIRKVQVVCCCCLSRRFCYGLNYISPKFVCWSPNPILQNVSLFGDRVFTEVKRRLLRWALIHLNRTDALVEKGKSGHLDTETHREERQSDKTQGHYSHLQAKARGLDQILLHSPPKEPALLTP